MSMAPLMSSSLCIDVRKNRSRDDFAELRKAFKQRTSTFVFDDPKQFNRLEAGLDTPFEDAARGVVGTRFKGNRTLVLRSILLGMALLFTLMAFALYNDITRLLVSG